ncbi:MAG TPA: nitroreductase family protein [Acidimicrobiales bacterium]|nr:nitroreductase family protein [Acidimicrobiales bacterium]
MTPVSTPFDVAEADRLLSTTRAVRRRLDLEREVEPEVLLECVRLSQQAPTPSNSQAWRWVLVTEAATRAALAEIYRRTAHPYLEQRRAAAGDDDRARRLIDSAAWLAEHLEEVPVHAIPCVRGRTPAGSIGWVSAMGGIFPAVWSFQLALRARGLGSTLTTFHLVHEAEAASLLGIPEDVMQVALLPVAYTRGSDFSPAERPPAASIVHWERWDPAGTA